MKKIIFCGFGKLGTGCLKTLIQQGDQIEFIMTHREEGIDSVDTFAKKIGVQYTYVDARKHLKDLSEIFKTIKPNLLVSVNYRYIIPKEIFELADDAINIHGSLLPQYRGRTPHVWSIINGEQESGITCHMIEETVDTGDIISQIKIPIEKNDTGYSLLKKFEESYPALLVKSINKIYNKSALKKQDERFASYYGKRTPDMGYIDFRKTGTEIVNFVRAQAEPYPGAYYYLLDGKKIIINKIVFSPLDDLDAPIGVIKDIDDSYYVRCRDCILYIENYKVIT